MKIFGLAVGLFVLAFAAAQTADWPTYGGNPQRTGWQKRETILNTGSVSGLKPLWKRKLDSSSPGLTAPIILGRIITHHGFQELVFIAGSSGKMFAIDADLNRVLWTRQLGGASLATPAKPGCGQGLTGTPLFPPLPGGAADDDEDHPFAIRPVHIVASDGMFYSLHPMTGLDMVAPVRFLAPGTRVASLNISENVLYTATSGHCSETPDGVWSLQITGSNPQIHTFASAAPGRSGITVGSDGAIYAALAYSDSKLSNAIVELSPGSLALRRYYSPPEQSEQQQTASPIVFSWKGKQMIVSASGSRIFVLEPQKWKALFTSDLPELSANGLAGWTARQGECWLYVATMSHIVAFKFDEKAERPALAYAWTSHRMLNPSAPVIANGVVYVLSAGDSGANAILYAFDAVSGKELYSSGQHVRSFTRSSGLAVANGHVCFGTWDNTLYCFGLPIDL